MLVVIDNYDSFTYNLVQYLGELGECPRVFRNDQVALEELAALQPDRIVISPGPKSPKEAASVATSSHGLPGRSQSWASALAISVSARRLAGGS